MLGGRSASTATAAPASATTAPRATAIRRSQVFRRLGRAASAFCLGSFVRRHVFLGSPTRRRHAYPGDASGLIDHAKAPLTPVAAAIKHRTCPLARTPASRERRRAPCSACWRNAAVGLDVAAVCATAGLSEAKLAQRTAPLALGEVVSVWRAAAREFGRGTLGLHIGAAMSPGTGSLMEYVAGASPDLRAALGQIARYMGLVSRNIRWVLGPAIPTG